MSFVLFSEIDDNKRNYWNKANILKIIEAWKTKQKICVLKS